MSAWLRFFCTDRLKFVRSNLHWDIKIFAKKTVTFEKSQENLLRDLKLYRPRSVDFGGCIQPFHDLNLRGSYTLDWNRYQPPTWIGRFREVYTAVPRPKSEGFIRTHHKMSRKTTWNTHLKQSMQGGSYRGVWTLFLHGDDKGSYTWRRVHTEGVWTLFLHGDDKGSYTTLKKK